MKRKLFGSRLCAAIRDEHRRELIEKVASQVVEKVGTDLKKVETDAEKAAAGDPQKVKIGS